MAFTFLSNLRSIIKGKKHKQRLPKREEEKGKGFPHLKGTCVSVRPAKQKVKL